MSPDGNVLHRAAAQATQPAPEGPQPRGAVAQMWQAWEPGEWARLGWYNEAGQAMRDGCDAVARIAEDRDAARRQVVEAVAAERERIVALIMDEQYAAEDNATAKAMAALARLIRGQ